MPGREQPPSPFWEGAKTAFGYVFGPFLAIMLGFHMGAFAAGRGGLLEINIPRLAMLFLAVLFYLPVAVFVSVRGLILVPLMLFATYRFWFGEGYRIEKLLAVCVLAEALMYSYLGGAGATGDWPRIGLAALAAAVLYAAARFGPWAWRAIVERPVVPPEPPAEHPPPSPPRPEEPAAAPTLGFYEDDES